MITPQFEVSQDDDFVYVKLRAPYMKASMVQFEVAGEVFVFSLPPYYLRLRFPHELVEDDRMTSRYDIATGTVECKVAKLVPGQHFEDLDMLTKLLATKRQQTEQSKPLIEELDVNPEQDPNQDEDFDWDIEIEQQVPSIELSSVKYGFDNRYDKIIGMSLHEGNEINEVPDPEHESLSRDDVHRLTSEKFNFDHYISFEHFDREEVQPYIEWKAPSTQKEMEELTPSEQDRVVKLGQRKHLVSQPREAYLALLQFIFGACFDRRTNTGDISVESAWNVGKLVPCACFLFNRYANVSQVVEDCTARALTLPYLRQWDLVLQVWKDTLDVLKHGRKGCLKILARLLEVFESDLHFCYRQIWVDDLTVWVQFASDKVLEGLSIELQKAVSHLDKKSIFLDLASKEAKFYADLKDHEDDSDEGNSNESNESDSDDQSEAGDSDDESDDNEK